MSFTENKHFWNDDYRPIMNKPWWKEYWDVILVFFIMAFCLIFIIWTSFYGR